MVDTISVDATLQDHLMLCFSVVWFSFTAHEVSDMGLTIRYVYLNKDSYNWYF